MTIAQQLKVTEFPFIIKDSMGNEIYHENSNGYWDKCEYNLNGDRIYYENSLGYWYKQEYDSNYNEIYWEDSTGYWSKREWSSKNNNIYYEDSNGRIVDNRPKKYIEELSMA